MTESALREALALSLEKALEKMFFTAVPSGGEGAVISGPEYAVRLSFDGCLRGRLSLRITAAAAQSMAADFLGEEEKATSERQVEEVVCELANIVCGSVLSRIKNRGEFRLGAPEAVTSSDPLCSPGAVAYVAEAAGGALEAVIEMEGPGCPSTAESAS